MIECLKITEEYLTLDEAEAEELVESMKRGNGSNAYELIGYSTIKKSKKNVEYYLIRITKEYSKEKDLIANNE